MPLYYMLAAAVMGVLSFIELLMNTITQHYIQELRSNPDVLGVILFVHGRVATTALTVTLIYS